MTGTGQRLVVEIAHGQLTTVRAGRADSAAAVATNDEPPEALPADVPEFLFAGSDDR